MKIISGKYRNISIPTIKGSDYRPSTTKFREALFSILSSGEFHESQPVIGAKILDLFAGTGSLSFEALSRGAKIVTLIDNNKEHLQVAIDFAKKIGEGSNVKALSMDATSLLRAQGKYDLVFMDPPYYKNYVSKALNSLINNQWLENEAIIAIEMSKKEEINLPDSLHLVKEKIFSNNKLLILKYE